MLGTISFHILWTSRSSFSPCPYGIVVVVFHFDSGGRKAKQIHGLVASYQHPTLSTKKNWFRGCLNVLLCDHKKFVWQMWFPHLSYQMLRNCGEFGGPFWSCSTQIKQICTLETWCELQVCFDVRPWGYENAWLDSTWQSIFYPRKQCGPEQREKNGFKFLLQQRYMIACYKFVQCVPVLNDHISFGLVTKGNCKSNSGMRASPKSNPPSW